MGSRYRLERMIGEGRMGTVWLATDQVLQRPVAVRLLAENRTERLASFTGQARSAASLWHPNLIEIYDFGMAEGNAFLVMEYLPGGTLHERFRRSAVSADQLRRLACDLVSALAYLHSRELRHGRVDAARVHLDGDGRAHLGGFGTAPPGPASSKSDDLIALGGLLAGAPVRRGDDPALDELIEELGRSSPGGALGTADRALEALRVCAEPAGQATQEFDVLSALAGEAASVEGTLAIAPRRHPRWAPRRVRAGALRLVSD